MSNIVINGATYKDVPSIQVPNENGEMVEFGKTLKNQLVENRKKIGWTEYILSNDERITSDLRTKLAKEKKYITRVASSSKSQSFEKAYNVIIDDISNLTEIGGYLFNQSISCIISELPKDITSIGYYAFTSAQNIFVSEIPANVTSIGNYAFYNCQQITLTELPDALTSLGTNVFYQCYINAVSKAYGLKSIPTNTFYRNYCMFTFDCFATVINAGAFQECINLTALFLRSETQAELSSTNALQSTPIASGTGYIYVPSAIVDSYKSATNWSVYANQFRALEDYTVDGTITGDLDESKI
jgi:hypothetical protein